MILAQYTIRSKQEYIFRSNRLLDIVGGTEMIRDAFDWVYAAAEQEGIVCQTADVPFTLQAVRDAFAAGILGMAELFRGGGNLTVLYRDRETYLRVNRCFSRLVLENAPGMIPMAACCEVDGQDYSADYKALMEAVDAKKTGCCRAELTTLRLLPCVTEQQTSPLSPVCPLRMLSES